MHNAAQMHTGTTSGYLLSCASCAHPLRKIGYWIDVFIEVHGSPLAVRTTLGVAAVSWSAHHRSAMVRWSHGAIGAGLLLIRVHGTTRVAQLGLCCARPNSCTYVLRVLSCAAIRLLDGMCMLNQRFQQQAVQLKARLLVAVCSCCSLSLCCRDLPGLLCTSVWFLQQ